MVNFFISVPDVWHAGYS